MRARRAAGARSAPPTSRSRRRALAGLAVAAAAGWVPRVAPAAEPLRVGLVIPLTGPFASTGRQLEAACRLYAARNGDTVAGRRVELIVRDDTGLAPETTRRLAQELVARDGVAVLAGFGLTPLALAAAPVATAAKVPMVVMAAALSTVPARSPYIVRSGFALPQVTAPIADWAARNGIRRVVTLVTDYEPGVEAETTFVRRFAADGGTVVESLRAPLRRPDFGPLMRRVHDARPDALFVFVPAGEGAMVFAQYVEHRLREDGVALIGTGDVVDDELLDTIGAPAVGVVTSFHYSAAHPSPENRAYVETFMRSHPGTRPNFHSVGGYDGMHLVYEALRRTGGASGGDALVAAMKTLAWTSPRGPVAIDPATRDIVNTVYVRRVELRNDHYWNVEFDQAERVRNPTP